MLSDEIMDRVVLTPAERAVLAEQAETMKAHLDDFLTGCKGGTPGDTLRAYTKIQQSDQYIASVLGMKVQQLLTADHESGRHD